MLEIVRGNYLIILSVKDTFGGYIPDSAFERIRNLGFSKLSKRLHQMYVGICDRGNMVLDKCGEQPDEPVSFIGKVHDLALSVTSQSWSRGNRAEITINHIDYSLDCRGLNIVVYDLEKKNVIDSITYDSYVKKPTFYHSNLSFGDEYFEKHFFLLEKYKKLWEAPYRKKYFTNRVLETREVENGIILPNKVIDNAVYGGVCDENFRFISGHATRNAEGGADTRHISGSYKVSDDKVEYIDETVVYGGTMIEHIGHLIVESFADRIWWFLQHPESEYKIAVSAIWGNGSRRFIREFFEVFGMPEDRIIWVKGPAKFRKVIIPEQSAISTQLIKEPYAFTEEYRSVFRHITSRVQPSDNKKIYFTKKMAPRQNVLGEDFFIEFYKKKGYRIINPEEYSLKEKIEFVMGADEFATQVGTNAHYAVFCKPSVKLTLLSRTNIGVIPMQAYLNETAGIENFYCVDISMNFLHKDFTYGIGLMGVTEEFKRYVREVFHEELEVSSEESLRHNLYHYLSYFPRLYTNPLAYNAIKNQKMISVLQYMSEIFLGEDFDTSKLDLSTNESDLQDKLKASNLKLENCSAKLDFLEMLFLDVLSGNRFLGYLAEKNCTTVSLMCEDGSIAEIMKKILDSVGIYLFCHVSVSRCADVPENAWEKCKKSDIVLGYREDGRDMGMRDGVKIVNICDVLKNVPPAGAYDKQLFCGNGIGKRFVEIGGMLQQLVKRVELIEERQTADENSIMGCQRLSGGQEQEMS